MIKALHSFRTSMMLLAMTLLTQVGWGQVNISAGNTITQNFDGIGNSAPATLPAGWKMENVANSRTVTTAYASVANTTTANALTYNVAMSTSAANGRWNFGGSTDSDRAIGGISSGSASQSVNMFLQLSNNGANNISSFLISYDAERYRNGTNAAGFSIRFYYSSSGNANTWTEVSDLVASFAGGNPDNTGSTTNPIQTISVSNKTLSQSLATGSSIYFAWSYSVTSGTTTSNAQALGIDNVSVTALTTPSAPTITGITASNQQLSVYFTAGATGGSALTNFKYSTDGGTSFTAVSPASTASPIVITGLNNGTSYNVQILAVNSVGDGAATASTAATPYTTPSAPTISGITPGNQQLSVAFTAGATGGSALTNYKFSTDGGSNWTAVSPASTSSPVVITGLTNGTAYNVQIRAVNAAGDGAATGSTQGTPTAGTLPVSLLSFSGYKDGIRNQLRWVTSSEINNREFQVERSSDGQSYQSIGFVNSLAIGGNSQTPLKYSFSDAQPAGVKQYYRLKQTDIDGRNTLSNILLIQGEMPTAFEIASVFPNPTRGQITMLLSAPTNETVNIRVMDLAGRILETRQVNVLTGNNSIPFDLSKQAKGQYLIQVGEKVVRVVRE